MIRKTSPINHVEETVNVKWCISKVPQYILILNIAKSLQHIELFNIVTVKSHVSD